VERLAQPLLLIQPLAGGRPRARRPRAAGRTYPRRVSAPPRSDPDPWDDDPGLTALLGPQGATALRVLFDGFPEPIGLLWSIRDDDGRIVDFDFGYG
jgi:hypothetical protein